MEYRNLGDSDLAISAIGVGAWAMGGGDWAFGWGSQDDRESISAIRAALDSGINWIDTAMVYGHGHSERVVGEAIRGLVNRPYVFTKCSRLKGPDGGLTGCLKSESIRRECEESLRNLGVDAIDLYQIHWPQPDEDIEEGWQTLQKLQEEGKVRHIGVSNFSAAQLARILPISVPVSLQPPYSLLRREIEAEVLPFASRHNIGVIAYSPMGSGLLSGSMTRERVASLPENDFRKKREAFIEPQLSRNLNLADKLREIGDRHSVKAGVVAIAWVLRRREVTGAIVGMRNALQVKDLIPALSFRLSPDESSEIENHLSAIGAAV